MPLSYRFNAEEMAYVIDNSEATVVVVDAEQAATVAAIRAEIPKVRAVVVFGGPTPDGCLDWDAVCDGQPDTEPPVTASSEAGAAMIYTSGTTGKPKGALRTRTDRELVFERQKQMGIFPADADLSPLNPYAEETSPDGKPWNAVDVVRPWDDLSDDENGGLSGMYFQNTWVGFRTFLSLIKNNDDFSAAGVKATLDATTQVDTDGFTPPFSFAEDFPAPGLERVFNYQELTFVIKDGKLQQDGTEYTDMRTALVPAQ